MTKSDQEQGFLSRWSQRKLNDESEIEESDEQQPSAEDKIVESDSEPDSAKIADEDLPIWQQQNADPELKRNALRELFSQAEFNERDGLNDYDYDYTKERKLGDIVTRQMKRMLKLAEQKKASQQDTPTEVNTTPSLSEQAENTQNSEDNNEDNKIA